MTVRDIYSSSLPLIRQAQQNELTEHYIYSRLAAVIRDPHNREVLQQIARDELEHSRFWKQHTRADVQPDRLRILKYYWISRVLGITFGIKLMEKGEEKAQRAYRDLIATIPEAARIADEEEAHENELIGMLEEEHLQYVGSIVLGLNDALVELTGTLAGLTFALQNTRLIALAGLITGIAASFSMAASEYLSTRSEEGENALKSAVYTGIAYIITVFVLVSPYLLLNNYLLSLAFTLVSAVSIIFAFNYYISVAKDLPFRKRFTEMASISLGVAGLSFAIGYVIRIFLGVEI